jgi:hypothetical protein
MAKDLIIHGPFEIPFRRQRNGNAKQLLGQHVAVFWANPTAQAIAAKQGCYIFALRAAKGFCPWYVGKATRSFRQEALGPYQLNHYNDVLFDGRKGTPVMFFIGPEGNKRVVPPATCGKIETFLIQAAYAENPEICNRQHTKIPDWTIKGVIRPDQGAPTKLETAFRKMMGIGAGGQA